MRRPNTSSIALRRRFVSRLVAGAFLAGALTTGLPGQTNIVWNVGSGNWSLASNWSPANTPNANTERAIFGNATGSTVTVDAIGINPGGIYFNSTAGSFTISRTSGATRSITLNGTNSSWNGIQSDSANNQLITGARLRVTLLDGATFRVGGAGNLTISATGGNITTLASTRTITLNGTGSGIGLISSTINGTGSVTKSDSGTWTLGGSNVYSGNTTITEGTLVAGSDTAFGTGNIVFAGGILTANATRTLTNNATITASSEIGGNQSITLGNATRNLTNTGDYTLSVTNTGGTTIASTVNLSNTTTNRTLTVAGTGNLTASGNITDGSSSGSNLTYSGSGNLLLSGTNTYGGTTTVTSGTVTLQNNSALGSGTAGATVADGATLALQGGIAVGKGELTVSGSGVGAVGALTNVSGANTYANNIALGANTTIATQSGLLTLGNANTTFTPSGDTEPTEGGFLTIGGRTLTFAGAGTGIVVNSRIRDFAGQTSRTSYDFTPPTTLTLTGSPETTNPGNVIVNMTGGGYVQYYAWANSYTGTTTVQQGELRLDTLSNAVAPHDATTASFHSINGNLIIGNGDATAASVKLYANETIAPSVNVSLFKDGTLDLAGKSQTIGDTVNGVSSGGLTFTGGNVTLGSGTLYLGANVTVNASAGNPVSITSNSTGYVSLTFQRDATSDANIPDQTRTFTVGNGGNTYDLTLSGIVQSGSLVKAGDGVMMMDKNNTYLGTTSVNAGILNIQAGTDGSNRSGLGSGDGTDARGTTVASDATLQLQGGIAITSEKLNLSGTGYSSLGALNNLGGNNTFGAAGNTHINLVADSTIKTSGGNLTIPTNIGSTGNNKALTFDTAAGTTITMSGGVNTGTGSTTTLTKTGSGNLVLSGASSYQGATNISAGVVSVQNNNGLGAVTTGSAGTFVSSGAELQLSNATSGNLTIGGESLTLHGAGVGGTQGALRNVAGNNSFGGVVTLGSAATIKSDANTLTLSGGISSSNQALTIAGAGNTTVTGVIDLGVLSASDGALTKEGAGTFTFGSGSALTGTVGQTHLNAGAISVAANATLNTAEFDSAASTTLLIASGGTVVANYASGTTVFSGTISGAGTFQKDGGGTLKFAYSFDAGAGSTLVLNGGILSLAGVQIAFGTIHITGNTILDFNNSANTWLTSSALVIDAGVTVTVNNWVSVANNAAASSIWYATNTINGNTLGASDQVGGTPLNQITFTGYSGLTPTWVSGSHDGWFNHEIRPTPEPATYGALMVSACLGLLGWRRFRNRKKTQA